MKKLITVIAAACLVFSAAGNAIAYFDYGDTSPLVLSIYNPVTNVETGYDLGVGLDLMYTNPVLNLGSVDVSDPDATVSLYSTNTAFEAFFGLSTETATGANFGSVANNNSAVRDIWNQAYLHGASPVTIEASFWKSANTLLGSSGSYAGIVSGGNATVQPTLNNLAADGFVDLFLYMYEPDTVNRVMNLVPGMGTDWIAKLTIQDTGELLMTPNAVPVPAAVWLMGSGLLALVGVRRKKN